MKKASVLIPSLILASSISFAKEKCYQALNPQNITITSDATPEQKEKAHTANASMDVIDGTPQITVKAQSKTYTFNTSAFNAEKSKPSEYIVDCDGGRVNAKVIGGILILNSKYMAGEITHGNEGCSEGSIAIKDLALEETACK
ncbi:hypothetical protein ACLSU7_01250 [Bdellovibrio sp. HCB185ZH]|uniref:hypothetical protein n=1 Tax=Bdellovibrio sp. HCB185ZH TaxID=3394235 RepID=UPI0039A66D1E